MAIQAVCKPEYLKTHIPRNHLAYMILAGAKGSGVNLQMMTTCLGQQSLEGKRVPTTACHRTLPCYRPFENIHPIAGGYIFDRYLTSLRPQSFFFHHQAGREGLVDTAVKTATSGYFQRCIIKSVEGISVKYDGTVRDGANSLLQLSYGGDGIDQTKKSMLHNFDFIFNNMEIYKKKYMGDERVSDVNEYLEKMRGYLSQMDLELIKTQQDGLFTPEDEKVARKIVKYYNKITQEDVDIEKLSNDGVLLQFIEELKCRAQYPMSVFVSPYRNSSITSTEFEDALNKYISQKHDVPAEKLEEFRAVCKQKYMHSLIQPGEAVGVISGHSVGEPSTQLTLNTFHLAGHGAVNVTLGIPRLREIIMSAKDEIKTPIISFECDDEESALSIRRLLNKVKLADVIKEVTVSDVVKNKRNLVTVDIELNSEYSEQDELSAIKSMAKHLQRLVSARIKTMNTQEVMSAAADEAQKGTGYKESNEDGNGENDNEESASSSSETETQTDKTHADEPEGDVVQCADQLFVLSNRFVTFENLEHVPNKRFKLVFSVDQCYHLLYLTFVEEAISKSTIH